jgi:hypothetical protein
MAGEGKKYGISDEEYQQLAFYASLSGMDVDQYIQMQSGKQFDQKIQAPQRNYEANSRDGVPFTPTQKRENTQTAAINQQIADLTAQTNKINNTNYDAQQGYFDNNVTPAMTKFTTAQADQVTANRAAENELRQGGVALNNSLNATQGQRMSAINSANSGLTSANNAYQGQLTNYTNQANQVNNAYQGQLTGLTAQQNAANQAFQGQLRASNQAAQEAYAGYQNKLDSSNAAMDAANVDFQRQLAMSNAEASGNALDLANSLEKQTDQGYQYVGDLEDKYDNLNNFDWGRLDNYERDTNPLLAEMKAQGSDPKYVQQMQDVYDQYKKLSNPEVTAQERFLAEQARLKTENQDKSSRDAAYAALQARGLNSGGQMIAAQYANRQQTAQDRVLAELGLQASAVGRSMEGLQGAQTSAGQLRSADDAMRQFQDQYAQNDAVRRAGVIDNRLQASLATSGQVSGRDTALYNAQQGNLAGATNRTGMTFDAKNAVTNANSDRNAQGFNANANTINSNSARDSQGYQANVGMINDNSTRNQQGFQANTATVEGNTNRANSGFAANNTTIQNNTARADAGFNANAFTNTTNFNRTSAGYDAADRNAGIAYGVVQGNTNMSTGNRQSEVGTAGQGLGLALAANGAYGGIQQGRANAQQTAAQQALGNNIVRFASDDEDEV